MLSLLNSKKSIIITMYKLFLLTCISVFFSACASKSVEMDEFVPSSTNLISTEEARFEDYDIAIGDDGIALTKDEQRAFQSIGSIDENLTAEDLALIRNYYKSYLHKSRKTIERFMYRAIPYLAFTREVFRSRGLPEELAFLAFIESGYNPWAISRANAVGMWQFMAPTGRHYGLIQDWWMDDRRDPYKATHAAADYLAKLYNDFGDWHLAIAAYNAGEGKIGRALHATGATNFFELVKKNNNLSGRLRIKEETMQYVPRFIAMSKIMRNFEMLGFKPEKHTFADDKPIIPLPAVEITAKPGTDLAAIAKELGMSWNMFAAYNPAYRRYITPPTRETKFYVPFNLHEKAIAASKIESHVGLSHYSVVSGDTLSAISKKVGVPVSVLRQLNTQSEPLQVGTVLKVPGHAGAVNQYTAAQSATLTDGISYKVRKGDTFGQIASKHKLSIQQLSAANPKVNTRKLSIGQTIIIPASEKPSTSVAVQAKPSTPSRVNTTTTSTATSTTGRFTGTSSTSAESRVVKTDTEKPEFHTLVQGDTFYSIARKYNMSAIRLGELNAGLNTKNLRVGDQVRLKEPAEYITYSIKKGDTFANIARAHNISLTELKDANRELSSFSNLSIGQQIQLPTYAMDSAAQTQAIVPKSAISAKVTPVAVKPVSTSTSTRSQGKTSRYAVKKGDTFHSIATKHGMTQDELALANPQIFSRAQISIGQNINIPDDTFIEAETKKLQASIITHTVQKGDTYWNISQRYSMDTDDLLELNKLSSTDILSIGMKLKVYKK